MSIDISRASGSQVVLRCGPSETERWFETVNSMKKPIKILQSLRTGRFEDVSVLGSQYLDHTGASSWYVAVWSDQNTSVRVYRLSGGDLPDHVEWADREALMETINLWENSPSSQPH